MRWTIGTPVRGEREGVRGEREGVRSERGKVDVRGEREGRCVRIVRVCS